MRGPLRSAGHLIYALLDFDISIQFPLNSTAADMRLPSSLSRWGSYNQPSDTAQGELDYDPFAFDVGCLGVLFWDRFGVSQYSVTFLCAPHRCLTQHLLPTVPMLAPLIDGMVTRNIARRFTAAQALQFFEDLYLKTTYEQLHVNPGWPEGQDVVFDDIRADRWRNLPGDFVRAWSHLREPKVPLRTRVLRRICKNVWCHYAVLSARRVLRSIRKWTRFV